MNMSVNMQKVPIVIVAAIQKKDRAIGLGNDLLWHAPEDMKRFKELTKGHPIIMGRKTFESILKILGKPLPNRTNIVVTRDTNYNYDGATIAHSLEEALEIANGLNPTEIHIGGGAEIYKQALPFVDRLHITWFSDDKTGDTFFPEFENEFEIVTEHPQQAHNDATYQWVDYVRK
jgi:dihydrofolate reductase